MNAIGTLETLNKLMEIARQELKQIEDNSEMPDTEYESALIFARGKIAGINASIDAVKFCMAQ